MFPNLVLKQQEDPAQYIFHQVLCAEANCDTDHAQTSQQRRDLESKFLESHQHGHGPDQKNDGFSRDTADGLRAFHELELSGAAGSEHHSNGIFPQRPNGAFGDGRGDVREDEYEDDPKRVKGEWHVRLKRQ
jgi:hypothetical protein